jgi:hypothetical protein
MPTRENCAQLEALLEATTALVELKKLVDKVEYDIGVLKARLGSRVNEGADATQANDDNKDGSAMEIDQAAERKGTEGDGGRALSVVSTRSGLSRKQVRVCFVSFATQLISMSESTIRFNIVGGYISDGLNADRNKTTKTELKLRENGCTLAENLTRDILNKKYVPKMTG